MQFVVKCLKCSKLLELDEGFRGAICRCSFCGALLEVPAGEGDQGKRSRPAAPELTGKPNQAANRAATGAGAADPGISSGAVADSRRQHGTTSVADAVSVPKKSRPSSPFSSIDIAARLRSGKNRKLFAIGAILAMLITIAIAVVVVYVLVLSGHPAHS